MHPREWSSRLTISLRILQPAHCQLSRPGMTKHQIYFFVVSILNLSPYVAKVHNPSASRPWCDSELLQTLLILAGTKLYPRRQGAAPSRPSLSVRGVPIVALLHSFWLPRLPFSRRLFFFKRSFSFLVDAATLSHFCHMELARDS